MFDDLFSFTGWDDLDLLVVQYYDVVARRAIGPIVAGETFDCVVVDFNKGGITFQKNGREFCCRIRLSFDFV